MCEMVQLNGTVCLNDGNSSSQVDGGEEVPKFEYAFLFILLVFFSLVTILGNLLVMNHLKLNTVKAA